MNQKKLIIFVPSIEGGGVEKNLFIISNYLVNKIDKISLVTISNNFKRKFNSKIEFISLQNSFWNKVGRRKKFFLSLFLLLFEILKNKNLLVFCFQGNIYCTLLCKLFGVKIIFIIQYEKLNNKMNTIIIKIIKLIFDIKLLLFKKSFELCKKLFCISILIYI